MELSRHEYWSAILSQNYLPHPGIQAVSPVLQADSVLSEPPGRPFLLKFSQPAIKGFFSFVKVPLCPSSLYERLSLDT